MNTHKDFEVGQWVKSYAKGIHRIEKFVPIEFEEYHFFVRAITKDKIGTLDEPLVILKRLFNSKLKKQVGTDFCSSTFLKPISAEEKTNIEEQLTLNPKFITDLDKYSISKFESRYGLNIHISEETKSILPELASFIREGGKTFTEIFEWLDNKNCKDLLDNRSTLDNTDRSHYLQFINWSYETKDNKLLFTDLLVFTPNFERIDLG
jgi:hypothetical protein